MILNLVNRTKVLEKALDAAWLRNEVIVHNIANVDTPGYKKQVVSFEEQLKSALEGSFTGKKTREKHLQIGSSSLDMVASKINVVSTTKMRSDGNNVDIDSEMASLAKNSIMYNALSTKLSREFQRIKNVINEGRR